MLREDHRVEDEDKKAAATSDGQQHEYWPGNTLPSYAEKACLVWDATWRGKREPLDDEAAAALGRDLEVAAEFRLAADSPLPPRNRELLERIGEAAAKLANLLIECPTALRMIERYWPGLPTTSVPPVRTRPPPGSGEAR
jgi:hypothetical protein